MLDNLKIQSFLIDLNSYSFSTVVRQIESNTFEIYLKPDYFISSSSFINVSNAFTSLVEKLAKKYFDSEVGWNNTGSTFWFNKDF